MGRDFIEGRFQLLHDTEENWLRVKDTFVPLEGEACITLDKSNQGRVKFGNGLLTWGELPYSNEVEFDGESIVKTDKGVGLVGYSGAKVGQTLSKGDKGLEWFTPVKTVSLGNKELQPTEDGILKIPVAGDDTLGVVKASEEVEVNKDGEMNIKKLTADKVQYDENGSIKEVLDERTKWEKF